MSYWKILKNGLEGNNLRDVFSLYIFNLLILSPIAVILCSIWGIKLLFEATLFLVMPLVICQYLSLFYKDKISFLISRFFGEESDYSDYLHLAGVDAQFKNVVESTISWSNVFTVNYNRKNNNKILFNNFSFDSPLLRFSNSSADIWKVSDACGGVQIFGAIGSGKTSGSGQAIARAYLAAGFGGLVLTASSDERALWERYAKEAGRSKDILIFSPDQPHGFNFLTYEMKRLGKGAGDTENLVKLFRYVFDFSQQQTSGKQDPYWDNALNQLMRNAIDIIAAATGKVQLADIDRLIKTAPLYSEQLKNREWLENSFCMRMVQTALEQEFDLERQHAVEAAAAYWAEEFPILSEKIRSIIVSMFTRLIDHFLSRQMFDLFCDKLTIVPEMSETGKIIILDLPLKEFGESGRLAQALFKYLWQKAVERRDIKNSPRPVFLWAEEAQNFCASYDIQFQVTARSAKACTVYLTQNIQNYYAAFGGGDKGKHEADALLGNLYTKIFHANSDSVMNIWAANMIGKSWLHTKANYAHMKVGEQDRLQNSTGEGTTESYDYIIPPTEFTELRRGAQSNGFVIDAIIFQSGRQFAATGNSYALVAFAQDQKS